MDGKPRMLNGMQKNRLVILAIFGMTIIPLIVALLTGGKAPFISGQTNYGTLIKPVISTKRSDFVGIDTFTSENLDEIHGHWLIINLISQSICSGICLENIQKVKQLHLMMNKDLLRIRRVAMFLGESRLDAENKPLLDDKQLLKVGLSEELIVKIKALAGTSHQDGMLLIMDPMGNLMMRYESGFDVYKVKSDLMHLLRISQIG